MTAGRGCSRCHGYTVVVLAFVVRKGLRAILAAYREGRRSADDPELLE